MAYTPQPVTRSPVPDLLFEDVQAARIRDIAPYLRNPETIGAAAALHRVTVFLTYRCNLQCTYCKSVPRNAGELERFPQRAGSFTLDTFNRLLRSYNGICIRHMHFTGGEAALVLELPQMMARAKRHGVSYTSITTNGTLPFRAYEALIESGLDEIRVSIDACDPKMGALLTGSRQAWPRSVRTLERLAGLRAAHPRLFVIANTVVTRLNRQEVGCIAKFLISLGSCDLKLITAIQEKDTLGSFPEVYSVVKEMETLVRAYSPGRFDLLKRKIHTVFDPTAIGLEEIAAQPDWRCYLPLTERTVDTMYYYPCSVYLREGGEPIGKVGEPLSLQFRKIAYFVNNGNCLFDPICRKYCLYCTKSFNLAANRRRERRGGHSVES